MPFTQSELDQVYSKALDGERDLGTFSRKEIESAKGNLDDAMMEKPELVKALIRVGIVKSTDTIMRALMAETKECAPVMSAVANIIAKTLDYKATHGNKVDAEFFGEVIKTEVDKTWVAMQGAFADHLKEEKREN